MLTVELSAIAPDVVTTAVETTTEEATAVREEVVGLVAGGVVMAVASGAGKLICGRIWGDSAPERLPGAPGGTGGPGGPGGPGGSGPFPDDNG